MSEILLARFMCDITPPLGHPLCGGLVRPAQSIADQLTARGVALLGIEEPIVLCSLDWCGVRNEAHRIWREQLACAAGTRVENVAVQCVHQHNAPIADLTAERFLSQTTGPAALINYSFFQGAVERTAEQLRSSLGHAGCVTHIGIGQARVERVASNRRILDAQQRVQYMRYSAARDPIVRAAPTGEIDPWLKTLSFWNGPEPLAALHYFATHPMSYYDDGRVTSDFVGLARTAWEERNRPALQIYFTGCAGDVAAGKFNDGDHARRQELAAEVFRAMQAAGNATRLINIERCTWRRMPLRLPVRHEPSFSAARNIENLKACGQSMRDRINAAFRLSWLEREHVDLELSCLDLGSAAVVHMPGEPFVFYQLQAQRLRPGCFVCVAGYGDGGPGYIPTDRAFSEGGYEPTVSMAGQGIEQVMLDAIAGLLNRCEG